MIAMRTRSAFTCALRIRCMPYPLKSNRIVSIRCRMGQCRQENMFELWKGFWVSNGLPSGRRSWYFITYRPVWKYHFIKLRRKVSVYRICGSYTGRYKVHTRFGKYIYVIDGGKNSAVNISSIQRGKNCYRLRNVEPCGRLPGMEARTKMPNPAAEIQKHRWYSPRKYLRHRRLRTIRPRRETDHFMEKGVPEFPATDRLSLLSDPKIHRVYYLGPLIKNCHLQEANER